MRLPDFRETAKGPKGDARAIIVQRVRCVRRSKWNAGVWRFRRSGCVRWPRRDDGRVLEQAGRIVLHPERRAFRQRGGERENAASKESYGPLLYGALPLKLLLMPSL